MAKNPTLEKVIFGAIIDYLVSDKEVLTAEVRKYLIHLAESDAIIETDTKFRILVKFKEYTIEGFDFSKNGNFSSLKDEYIREVQSKRETNQIILEKADERYGWYISTSLNS